MSQAAADSELRARLRQQEILATIGAAALRGGDLDILFRETSRLVAQGLETGFSKVMEFLPNEHAFLVRAGVGWNPGVVGHARIGTGHRSPAGHALKTRQAVIADALDGETCFEIPALLLEHGIKRTINVVIRRERSDWGVLEADGAHDKAFAPDDVAFMQAAANLLGIAIDRKMIEVELAHSHARISDVLDSISDAFYAVDHDWRFVYFNRNAEVMWRKRRSDVLGKRLEDVFADVLDAPLHEALRRASREHRVTIVEAVAEKLGRWLDVSIFPSADGLSVYMRDVTERKQSEAMLQASARLLEERVAERTRELADANGRLLAEIAERERAETALMQAHRLEAIGQLTGGVAHDFNNLLTAVIGNLELLERDQTEERAKRHVQAALQAAQRGAALTQQLLAYARKQRMKSRPLDLHELIRAMREMLRRTLGELFTIEVQSSADGWLAMADPAQVETIILNVALNARDAMPGGGRLRIGIRDVPAHAPDLPDELITGEYVAIAVSDGGTGMPPEVMARAFEPFFTTKGVGGGSGLGLAQVHGVATQFGGTARLRSDPGLGTTVEVFLPRADEAALQPPTADYQASETVDGTGIRLLVVDDEADVRAIAAAFLEQAGFEVRRAGSGAEALALLEEQICALALVDHAMPGMSGLEFVRRARERHADLRVVYLTGHAESLNAAGIDPRDVVLAKPYSAAVLLHHVRHRLPAEPLAAQR